MQEMEGSDDSEEEIDNGDDQEAVFTVSTYLVESVSCSGGLLASPLVFVAWDPVNEMFALFNPSLYLSTCKHPS